MDKRRGDEVARTRVKTVASESERIRDEERQKIEKELEAIRLALEKERAEVEASKSRVEDEVLEKVEKLSEKLRGEARVEMAKVAREAGIGAGSGHGPGGDADVEAGSDEDGGEGSAKKYDVTKLQRPVLGGGDG